MSDPDSGESGGIGRTNRRRILQAVGGLGAIGVGSGLTSAGLGGRGSDAAQAEAASTYTKTVLSDRMNNLIDLAPAPDGRVFYITRGDFFEGEGSGTAEIGVVDPETGEDTVALELDVFTGVRMEDGGQGVSLDPDFEENGWVYVYYSPSNEEIAETEEELEYLDAAGQSGDDVARPPSESIGDPYNLLSRFTVEDGAIDPDSEVEILRVPVQRDVCCHEGGDIQWGPEGENLYLMTGDNTYSKAETDSGYAPMDEREGREYYDAQRTSADTSDLRGKILRITPQDDGSYTVPDDNLFTGEEYAEEREEGTVRPEIYVMGARNPFQGTVDQETGTLFWGDYSADSRQWSAERGPPGFNEFNRAATAGNYGWPYVTGPYAYVDWDYVNEIGCGLYDPQDITNDSPHSGGIEDLPPARDPFIWYPGDWSALDDAPNSVDLVNDGEPSFPDFEGGAPIGGPVYRPGDGSSELGVPDSHDGDLFISEFGQGWIRTVSFEGSVADGPISEIDSFASNVQFQSPIDLEFGPDGRLFVADYGSFSGEGSELCVIERGDVESVSAPFGYDAGGGELDGTVTIDGLDFVSESSAVSASGSSDASSTGTEVQPNLYPDPPNPIDGTEHDALYQTEEFGGDLSYEVAVRNGTYDVTLHFAETNPDLMEGDRVFDVSIEGEQVLSEFDIYAEAGHDTAVSRTFEGIEVSDGTLNISTETLSDNSKFGGFAIRPAEDSGDGGDGGDGSDGGDGAASYTVPRTDGGTADEPAFTLAPEGDTYTDTDGDSATDGPDDLSADVFLGYGSDELHLRVEVTDDTHTATSGSSMWQADSLQWAVASDDTYGPEYGLSHAEDGTSIHRWIGGNAAADASAVEASTSREGSTTTYEATVPWNALFAEGRSPGDSFPFGVLVNERDDGDSRDAVLGWTLPGINDEKTPSALGTLTLEPDD